MPLLLHGDCLEVMRDLSDHSVDCFICDLPYGCLSNSGQAKVSAEKSEQYGKGSCEWDVKIDLSAFWTQVKRLARNDRTPVLMFCNTKFGFDLYNSNPTWFRYDLVWDKGLGVSFLLANKQPMKSHEMIYVFSKKGTFYKRVDISGDFNKWKVKGIIKSQTYCLNSADVRDGRCYINRDHAGGDGSRCVKSVINNPRSRGKGLHPTEKPIALYKWLLERYVPDGGTVLDPTAGSFNAIIAATELGYEAIGIEKDEGFFKKGQAKFADPSGNIIQHIE